ncbi:serine hydrolase domain-containing protein [Glacieibacterium frigidum]|uniref:Beta-lactamase family protein n=1 Tax=Glacieibacterium frigidum TaxID=2593303 RepID=A0A552UGA8_9SPHN|nr:serine hydrolase domain-containing protein [Glacieibacterium frigidum]TRW17258.1 beta-lactamase family protein [Glacieibacterium frigidum]
MKILFAVLLAVAVPCAAAAPPPALAKMWEAANAAALKTGLRGHLRVGDLTAQHGAEVGPQVKMMLPAMWRWASVSKQIVATAVMQQVEAGKLDLDTPIARYASKLKIANAGKVTLRQLLMHTSGLPNVEDGPVNERKDMLVQFLRTAPAWQGISPICLGPAKAEPGARFEYNDCDTEIVGAVLEAVTGRPLAKLLDERIFRPAGMTGARLLAAGDPAGRRGYFADGVADDYVDVGRFGAAGAVAGPPADLVRFDQALLGGRLIGAAARAEMWKGEPKLGFVALGQWSYTVPLKGCATPVALVERRGQIGGVEICNVIAPALGRIVVAFTDRPTDFGEPWQGKGVTYELLSAALCSA